MKKVEQLSYENGRKMGTSFKGRYKHPLQYTDVDANGVETVLRDLRVVICFSLLRSCSSSTVFAIAVSAPRLFEARRHLFIFCSCCQMFT
jgi:hypothetical protein